MKTLRNLITTATTGLLLTGLALSFNACTEGSPLQSGDEEATVDNIVLGKRGNNTGGGKDGGSSQDGTTQSENYPQYASRTYSFQTNQGTYQGGKIQVPGGTSLQLSSGALTPPPDTPIGADVTLTMEVIKKKHQGQEKLEFTFGPHGCVFNPPAAVIFDWTDLNIDAPTLYYFDASGKAIPETPDQVDIQNKKMILYINHFSRYALAAN